MQRVIGKSGEKSQDGQDPVGDDSQCVANIGLPVPVNGIVAEGFAACEEGVSYSSTGLQGREAAGGNLPCVVRVNKLLRELGSSIPRTGPRYRY
jgi:hypothetical protein